MQEDAWKLLSVRILRGMTYNQYREYFAAEIRRVSDDPALAETDEHAEYLALNFHRTARIEKTYTVCEALKAAVRSLKSPQIWMALTEAWCGDSAQNLPYIAGIADCSSITTFRILLRDQNTDIMDRYLTAGTRSIPKLVAFDGDGRELFRWGPRPLEAMDLFQRARQAGVSKPEISERLHLWYGRNRGRALEQEFLEILGTGCSTPKSGGIQSPARSDNSEVE